MGDKVWILKAFTIVATLGLALWAFAKQEYVIGGVALVLFGLFFWFLFLRNIVNNEPLDLIEMIKLSMAYLEDNFKISTGISDDFKMWGHAPSGKTEYRLVFYREDGDGQVAYYPVTIDRYSGKFGEATGTTLDSISMAQYFLGKSANMPQSHPVSLEDVQSMFEEQRASLNQPAQPKPEVNTSG